MSYRLRAGGAMGALALMLTQGCIGVLPTIAGDDPRSGDGTSEDEGSATDTDGDDGTPGGDGSGSDDPLGPGGKPPAACATPGPRLVRRLTAAQYRNTLVDLFDDANVPTQDVLADAAQLGFHVDADANVVRDLGAEQLINYTEKVAAWAVANKLDRLSSCRTNDATCRAQFFDGFGLRAFREPMNDEARAAYDALFAGEPTFERGLETALTAMLMSPNLLFRRELGEEQADGLYALTAYEMASELSYLVTDSAPDAELLEAARSGALADAAERERQVERLLQTERGRGTLTHFLEGWLEIDRLRTVVKDESQTKLSAELREKMLGESTRLFLDAFDGDKTAQDLLSAPYTFMDRTLSEFYGVFKTQSDQFERVDLGDDVNRAPGILGTGGFLAAHALSDATSPVKRGFMVRERLLCQKLPPPPSDVDTNLEPIPEGVTNRERYALHSQNARCAACHQLMDPIGFTFEHFDTFGRYQETDQGQPIDSSGALVPLDASNVPDPSKATELAGAADLAAYVADAEQLEPCVARFWSYYAYGRDAWEQKSCTTGSILAEAEKNGSTLKQTFLSLFRTPHFSRRVRDL